MVYGTIVCGVTGSPNAQKAALEAAVLAKRDGAKLIYVYAVDDSAFRTGRLVELGTQSIDESLENLGVHILNHVEVIAKTQGVSPEKILRKGAVLDVLKQVITENKADLLVLGHEDRSYFDRMLYKGSVGDRIQELQEQTGVEVSVIR